MLDGMRWVRRFFACDRSDEVMDVCWVCEISEYMRYPESVHAPIGGPFTLFGCSKCRHMRAVDAGNALSRLIPMELLDADNAAISQRLSNAGYNIDGVHIYRDGEYVPILDWIGTDDQKAQAVNYKSRSAAMSMKTTWGY